MWVRGVVGGEGVVIVILRAGRRARGGRVRCWVYVVYDGRGLLKCDVMGFGCVVCVGGD